MRAEPRPMRRWRRGPGTGAGTLASLVTLVGVASLLAGCAVRHAPLEWLPYAQSAQRDGFGGWIVLRLGAGPHADGATGELLAVSPDSLYTLRDSTLNAFPLTRISRATLEVYDPKSGELANITLAGTFATITHGWWLIITAPLWVIIGSSSTAALSYDGMLEVKAADSLRARSGGRRVLTWKDLALHARFPQGMPPGLDRTALHERPHRVRPGPQKPFPGSITTR